MLFGSVESKGVAYPTHGAGYGRRSIGRESHLAACPEFPYEYDHLDVRIMSEHFSPNGNDGLDPTILMTLKTPRALTARDHWHVLS